jgi:ferredoxin-thioredoxin reductase catalytic subunit
MSLKIIPNSNKEIYNSITQLVIENNGYCPCLVYSDETTKCICKDFREQETEGECHCGRFIKVKE